MEIDYREIENAYMFLVDMGGDRNQAFLCKKTGKVYLKTDYDDWEDEEPLPKDLETSDQYIELPDKKDLDLGQGLVFRFVQDELPDDYDQISDVFGKKGAYSRFKDFLARKDMLEKWYEYESQAERQALERWIGENGFSFKKEA